MTTQLGVIRLQQFSQIIFDGDDYDYWSIKMKIFLISQDLWEIVEDGYEVKTNAKGKKKAESEKQAKENRMKDANALFYIQQVISPKIFPRIIGAKSSNEAWDIFRQEFQENNKVRTVKLLTLKSDFHNLQMKGNESLIDYFSKVMELENQIKGLGENLSDKVVCEKILISLSSKYNNIVAIIEETKDLTDLHIHDLMVLWRCMSKGWGDMKIHHLKVLFNPKRK